jgi:hypothetical protein
MNRFTTDSTDRTAAAHGGTPDSRTWGFRENPFPDNVTTTRAESLTRLTSLEAKLREQWDDLRSKLREGNASDARRGKAVALRRVLDTCLCLVELHRQGWCPALLFHVASKASVTALADAERPFDAETRRAMTSAGVTDRYVWKEVQRLMTAALDVWDSPLSPIEQADLADEPGTPRQEGARRGETDDDPLAGDEATGDEAADEPTMPVVTCPSDAETTRVETAQDDDAVPHKNRPADPSPREVVRAETTLDTPEAEASEGGAPEDGASEVGASEVGASEDGASEVGASEDGAPDVRARTLPDLPAPRLPRVYDALETYTIAQLNAVIGKMKTDIFERYAGSRHVGGRRAEILQRAKRVVAFHADVEAAFALDADRLADFETWITERPKTGDRAEARFDESVGAARAVLKDHESALDRVVLDDAPKARYRIAALRLAASFCYTVYFEERAA